MDDIELVLRIAAEMTAKNGREAFAYVSEQADAARIRGDDLAADAWLDLAKAVAVLLSDEARPSVPPSTPRGDHDQARDRR